MTNIYSLKLWEPSIKLWQPSINNSLFNDTLIYIFRFCDPTVRIVCRKWKYIIDKNNLLWYEWYKKKWDKDIFDGNWRQKYYNMTKLNYNWFNDKYLCITFYENSWIIDTVISDEYIITGSKWGIIKLWSINKIKLNEKNICPKVYSGHLGPISCLDYHSKKQCIVSGSHDGTIRIWHIDNFHYKKMLTHHSDEVYFVKYYKNCIYSGSKDCTIKIYNTLDESVITLKGHTMSVWTIDFDDKDNIYTGSLDGTVKMWKKNGNNYTCIKTLCITKYSVLKVCYYKKYLFIGTWSGNIEIWNNNKIFSLNAHQTYISGMKIIENKLVTTGFDNQIKIWKIIDDIDIHLKLSNILNSEKITSIDVNHTSIVCTSANGKITYYNFKN